MCTAVESELGQRIAVCLFGSMHNLSGYIREAGPVSRRGWTSSNFVEIQAFLRQRCERRIGHLSRPELAVETLKAVYGVGTSGADDPVSLHPRNRSFTYCDIQSNAEWYAKIHCDIDFVQEFRRSFLGFDRVLIGSPLWLASPVAEVFRYADPTGPQRE